MTFTSMRNYPHLTAGLNDMCEHVRSSLGREPALLVEVGSYAGESIVLFAAAFPTTKIVAVDPWEPNFDPKDPVAQTPKNMADAEALFDARVRYLPNIVKLKQCFTKAVHSFGCNTIDLLYLDGNHSYAATRSAILAYLPKVSPGGFVAGHDYYESQQVQVASACWDTIGRPDKVFNDTSWVWQKTQEKMEARGS
jgi:predicted O-methyltransferase YrrM